MFQVDQELVEQHRHWLSDFDPQHARNWEKLLAADAQAAMCEAAVRRLLADNGNAVSPNESLDGSDQAPDFCCQQSGLTFYVEVTCIGLERATEETSPTQPPTRRAGHYRALNGAFFNAARQKAPQCANLPGPALVAVATFHFEASVLCIQDRHVERLLTGETMIAWDIDTRTGSAVGDVYQLTHLRSATFVRPDETIGIGVGHARNCVSGMLLCGFGCEPSRVRGVLHPSPVRPFDRALLPKVRFCRLRSGYQQGTLSTEWI